MSDRCELCCISFKSPNYLQKHLLSKKHIDRQQQNVKLYTCVCGKMYTSRNTCYVHRRTCPVHKRSTMTVEEQIAEMRNTIDEERERHELERSQLELDLEEKAKEITDVLSRLSQVEAKIKRQPTIIYQDNKRCKIPDQVRLDICTKQNGQCNGCDQVLGDFFQLDHIVALRFGGTNDDSNLQALCGQCHNEKSALESIHRLEIQEAVSTILEKHKESRRLNMATS